MDEDSSSNRNLKKHSSSKMKENTVDSTLIEKKSGTKIKKHISGTKVKESTSSTKVKKNDPGIKLSRNPSSTQIKENKSGKNKTGKAYPIMLVSELMVKEINQLSDVYQHFLIVWTFLVSESFALAKAIEEVPIKINHPYNHLLKQFNKSIRIAR